MMKITLKLFFLILIAIQAQSQQIVMFDHYFFKPMVYNPAYTGNDSCLNIMLINHTQWTGFKGGPQYNIANFDGNFINKNTGLGVTLISDRKGINSRFGGNISYSYKLKFKNRIYLRLGLSAGIVNQSIDYSKIQTESANDPSLFANVQSKTTFDVNGGLAFVCKDFELGISAPQIANNKIGYDANNNSKTYYTQNRQYVSSLKYNFLVSKEKNVMVAPLALIRYMPNTPLQYTGNVTIDWKNKLWLGVSYKNNYAVGINAGVVLFKQLSVGYNYDYITGNLNKYAGLSHEIMLSFKFHKKADRMKAAREEDRLLKEMSQKNLNKILIENLIKKIDVILDKEHISQEEIYQLLEEISSFFDENSPDKKTQEILNKYYNALKQNVRELNVLLKGRIIFTGNPTIAPYSKITITITDLGTKKVIDSIKPSTRDGKYYTILKPGRKYSIFVECAGYQNFQKNFSPAGSSESYEMTQEITILP
ncbi:MAG: type IX secretion system membrane protein PorP/SprF [Bacteroidota bacterium]